jgi:uncharacterized protein (TIGR02145 family)
MASPMRKLLLTTAAVAAAIAGAVAAEPEYGIFTDERDGKVYRTAKIGNQTWMAWNLNYKTPSGSWCYNDSLSYCKKYGRLYNWETAQKACPTGYHLPSREEWDSLAQAVGGEIMPVDYGNIHWLGAGKKLKTKSGWNQNGNGTNDFGFSALPSGTRGYDGKFSDVGNNGYYWTASRYWDSDDNDAYYRFIDKDHNDLHETERYADNSLSFSVRCVADNP